MTIGLNFDKKIGYIYMSNSVLFLSLSLISYTSLFVMSLPLLYLKYLGMLALFLPLMLLSYQYSL